MKSIHIFTILLVYILFQFIWWSYLLVKLNSEVYEHRIENVRFRYQSKEEAGKEEEKLLSKLHTRYWMVVGEGAVFLVLLSWVTYQTIRSFRSEMELASMQKNFLLSITHEFKSPLASIKLYLQTLQKHSLDKEKEQAFISKAISDTERLDTLVENTLLANMIDHKGYKFNKELINISALTRLVTQKFNSLPNATHCIRFQIAEDVHMLADKLAFTLLLNNLFENAIKYSPPGTEVMVELLVHNGKIILRVSDQGYGIPGQEREKVFRKFYRIGSEETRNTKGTGLGLFLARYIAENHSGKISVRNNQPAGSIFEAAFSS